MAKTWTTWGLGIVMAAGLVAAGPKPAYADEAEVSVGRPERSSESVSRGGSGTERFAEPPEDDRRAPIAVDAELRRSSVRFQLGPAGVTTGKGFGVGVGLAAEFGSGSVGGRLSAAWLRGEGTSGDGSSTPTGNSVGLYGGEVTLDLHKRGPIHPSVGLGIALLHVSREDTSGYAGVGTGRFALDYALGLEDADVRIGADIGGGLVGPQDDDIKNMRAYALVSAHLAIGF